MSNSMLTWVGWRCCVIARCWLWSRDCVISSSYRGCCGHGIKCIPSVWSGGRVCSVLHLVSWKTHMLVSSHSICDYGSWISYWQTLLRVRIVCWMSGIGVCHIVCWGTIDNVSYGCVGARWGCLCMAILSTMLGFGGVEVAILARVSILRGGDVFNWAVVEGFVLADYHLVAELRFPYCVGSH